MECHFFKTNHCHSCELLSRPYADTLRLKEERLRNLFSGIDLHLKPTVFLDEVEASRNKAKLAVIGDSQNIEFGLYDRKAEFKTLEECPLHMVGINELLPLLREKLLFYRIIPYSVATKKGELKYVIISKGEKNQDFLVRFTLRSKESLDRLRKMAQELEKSHPEISVVTANIQPEHKAVLEGEEEIILSSKAHIHHQFGDVTLTLGPRSFFQVTPRIAHALYESAKEALSKYQVQSFLDLFCGVGAFSYFAAKSIPHVLGVEISKEAIDCAQKSKHLNKVSGVIDFRALDVEAFLKTLGKKYEAILVNPPRRGLNSSIIKNIMEQSPKVVIYSSCNAETLARDFLELASEYGIVSTQVFDMFPFTDHFETLMILTRKDA